MIDFHYEPPEPLRKLSEELKAISAQNRFWTQPIEDAIHRYDTLFQPAIDALKQWDNKIKQVAAKIEIPPSLRVIECFKSSQYVFWDYLTKSFMESVLLDSDGAILEYESSNDYSVSEDLLCSCRDHPFLLLHQKLFNQTVDAYHLEMYDIAAVGFTAIIDAVLSEATQNPTHRPKDRYSAVLDKLMAEEFVADEEYATLILFMTFNTFAKSFYETIPFSDEEPQLLNRNWIMHGRSQREYKRIDCIKLLRFLYGIILVDYIDSQGIVPNNEESSTE